MPFDPCDPCSCIPGNPGNEWFKQAVIQLLCNISAGEGGGSAFVYAEDSAFTTGDLGAFTLGVRNTALADLTSTDLDFSAFAVNIKGAIFADINASAQQSNPLGLLKLEDAATASGDAGVAVLLKRSDTASAQTTTDGDYTLPVTNSYGQLRVGINRTFQTADTDSILKAEDAASSSGDAGVAVLAYLHDTPQTATVDASGDYGFPKGNTTGALYANIDFRSQVNTANGLLKAEDAASSSGDAGVAVLAYLHDTPQTATVDASGDYGFFKGNTTGAQYVNIDFRSQVQTANGLLKSEDAASADGDAGVVHLAKRTDTPSSQTTTDGDYTVPVANSFGSQHVNIDSGFQRAAATGIMKIEDVAQADGDSGVAILIRGDDTPQSSLVGSSGDYCFPKCNTMGGVYANIDFNGQVNTANGILKQEDVAHSSGHAGVFALAVRNDTDAASTTTDADYSQISVDSAGKARVIPSAGTVGGATPYSLISAATNNATAIKASAGQVYSVQVFNTNAAARYLKLYNKASAPDPSTDTPIKRITVPGAATGAGATMTFPVGVIFTTGIAFLLVTGAADTDNTSVAASELMVNVDYK